MMQSATPALESEVIRAMVLQVGSRQGLHWYIDDRRSQGGRRGGGASGAGLPMGKVGGGLGACWSSSSV
ncbi:MAG: hypothetical protein R2710_20420 [Acidimicrobiales bacterium]